MKSESEMLKESCKSKEIVWGRGRWGHAPVPHAYFLTLSFTWAL